MDTHKTVPLVVYVGGERIVIGEARVSENTGHVEATINNVGGHGFEPGQMFDFSMKVKDVPSTDELTVTAPTEAELPLTQPDLFEFGGGAILDNSYRPFPVKGVRLGGKPDDVLPEFPIKYPDSKS